MRKVFICVLLAISATLSAISTRLMAEEKLRPMSQEEIALFEKSLKEKSDATQSLEAVFVQEKNLEMLNRKMVSKGVFKFRKEDKIAFLYDVPLKYQLIINGNRLKMVNNGKSQVVELKNNPLMKEMKGLIEASFLGRLSKMDSSYKISYFRDGRNIVVIVLPTNTGVSEMIDKISITFDGVNLNILQLKLYEGAKSTTIYNFSDQKFNTIKSDESFSIS